MEASSTCLIHICDEENESLKLMTHTNWVKIKSCAQVWINLDGKERLVSSTLTSLPAFQQDEFETNSPSEQYFYHKKCYAKFTNINNIERAKKRLQKALSNDTLVTLNDCPQSKRRRTSYDRNQKGLFPDACLICNQKQYYVERYSGKRKPEKLVKCQTFEASNAILSSALSKQDQRILLEIQNVDMIAKEVKYHKSCYKHFTRKTVHFPTNFVQPHEESYSAFCKIVDERLIKNCEILSMNKLARIYAGEVRGQDEHDITNRQLKRWLQRDYPQLSYVKPKQRNLPELVLFRDSLDELVVIDSEAVNEESTDMEGSAEEDTIQIKCDANFKVILYESALILRNLISESKPLPCAWPPTAEELNRIGVRSMVPHLLFNFLAWCIGATEEMSIDDFVEIEESAGRKILSIAQDLIYLESKGKKQTPKHLSLAMAVRHVTGSAKIIELLNGLGHSISHTAVLEYDTALAEMQLKLADSIPSGIVPKQPVTLVWDNIDFNEETVTGHNTTHYTNGIIVQKAANISVFENTSTSKLGKKSRLRTIDPPTTVIFNYTIGQRCNPRITSEVITCTDEKIKLNQAKLLDAAYIFSKCSTSTEHLLPGWTGYNYKLENHHVSPESTLSNIRYLPVLEANPTEFSTINTILKKSLEIANKIGLGEIVLVFDQAIYAKAQQIRWKEDLFQQRIVIRLGEFHIMMAFLAVLGKRFKDAGLQSIMVESGIVAEGSVNGILSGKHYNRSIRCHKLVYEALSRLLWNAFLSSLSIDQHSESLEICKRLCELFELGSLREDVPKNFISLMESFDEFVHKGCRSNATFAFWSSYLDMIGCLLNFLRATRSADWKLHLAATEEMVPWFFSYDHVNYARYLPIYLLEMLNLEHTHPTINDQLCSGDFVTKRQHAFSGTAMDQTIEQTANRDSKTKGGLTGFTRNSGAVHRWMLSHHMRAQISICCEELAGKQSHHSKKKDLAPSQIKMHEVLVTNVLSTITSMINSFSWYEDVLVNISSGAYATQQIQNHLLNAKCIGTDLYHKYCSERLHKDSNTDIHSKITQQKLETFSSVHKKSPKNDTQKVSLKNNTDILARIIVMGQTTSLDMKYILTFNLNDFPPAIANPDGTLVKTNKAALIHTILGSVDKSATCANLAFTNTLILDGMSILQQMKNSSSTFKDLAEDILKYIIHLGVSYGCKSVHFVTDTYPLVSIKDDERRRRSSGISVAINIQSPQQKLPKQFKQFLTNGKNKEALVQLIYEQWSTFDCQLFKDITVFLSHGPECHKMFRENRTLAVQEVLELYSDHVEADTKILLHANYASAFSSAIVIKCPDTDVFIMTLAMCKSFKCEVYMLLGNSFENITELNTLLGTDISTALIGLHIFTGCDTCSAFKSKGKVKPYNIMKANPKYIEAFTELGSSWELADSVLDSLEAFVCELYGDSELKKVNDLRYKIFKLKYKIDVTLPPNYDSLLLHIKRCNYQANVHRRCAVPIMNAPSPDGNGWCLNGDDMKIKWNAMPSIPESLVKHVSCSCAKTACKTKQCSCKASNVTCTDACSCLSCCNIDKIDEIDVCNEDIVERSDDDSDEDE